MEQKKIKILSWNLLHNSGAMADDIARLIELHRPDLVLMQEVTPAVDELSSILGGYYYRQDWPSRKHGLATWSAAPILTSLPLSLPYSKVPGSFPQRMAQLVNIREMTIANVHLSHGQTLNRKQLSRIATSTQGPTAIIGDYNAVGPIRLKAFKDVGPKGTTHKAQQIIPLRLDRCMTRGLNCVNAVILDKGNSDHKPILVELENLRPILT